MTARTPWLDKVAAVVSAIPKGRTASYAQVALMAGKPGASRAVVRALHSLDDVPWWRVVKSDGTVAKEMFAKQAPKLRKEGVQLNGRRVARTDRKTPSPSSGERAGARGSVAATRVARRSR